MQGIMTEYPTDLQFLNQHGDMSLFADGFTALERKYLKYLLLRLNDRVSNISDIVVKNISKKDLHKVLQYPLRLTVLQLFNLIKIKINDVFSYRFR